MPALHGRRQRRNDNDTCGRRACTLTSDVGPHPRTPEHEEETMRDHPERPCVSRRRFLQASAALPLASGASLGPFLSRSWAADARTLVIAIGSDVGSLDPDKYTNWNDYWAYGNM